MIVFVSELYSMPATLCSQVHKIRANIKSGLDSDTQKLGVTNHGQILQENSLTQLVDPLAQEKGNSRVTRCIACTGAFFLATKFQDYFNHKELHIAFQLFKTR